MCAEKRELLTWIKDVSKVSGVETMIIKEQEFSRPLTETVLMFTLLICMTLAVSAAYYLQIPSSHLPDQPQNLMLSASAEPLVIEQPTTTSSTTTTEAPTTSTTTSTTTSSTTTTTSTSSTTSTTVKCGFDMEPPCITESGLVCSPGNKIGAEGLCHQLSCVKTVPSGNTDGNCGSFAMSYCEETE